MKAQSIRRENLTSGGRMKRTIRKARHHNNTVTTNLALFGKKPNHESKDCYFRCKRCKIANHSQKNCSFQNKEKTKMPQIF